MGSRHVYARSVANNVNSLIKNEVNKFLCVVIVFFVLFDIQIVRKPTLI